MSLVKSGNISSCCTPNALLTLKEYLEDYASCDTKGCGERLIKGATESIPSDAIRRRVIKSLSDIESGDRDFRF